MASAAPSVVADETYLSNAEVCILLTKQKEMRAAQGLRVTEEFEKTLSATTRFSGIDRPHPSIFFFFFFSVL